MGNSIFPVKLVKYAKTYPYEGLHKKDRYYVANNGCIVLCDGKIISDDLFSGTCVYPQSIFGIYSTTWIRTSFSPCIVKRVVT